jgi:hypothetical protein
VVAKAQLSLSLEHPPGHFEALHHEAHGTVLVWEALKPGKQWKKLQPGDPAIPGFMCGLAGQHDTYISINEFDGWRLVRLLRSLRAVYVDLDGMTDLDAVLDALREAKMPAPSLAVFSGRGLHLYWLLQPLPPKALPVWQRVTDALNAALLPLGADPKARDCTRVLRLVGTVNSKNGATVRGLILTGYRWTLHELADEVLGHRKPRPKASVRDIFAESGRQGRKAPRVISGSIYERWYKVYGDLLTIAKHHGGLIPEGHRDAWLFLTAVALSWFTKAEALEAEIENAARTFTTLTPMEVRKVARTIQHRAELAAQGETVEWAGQKVDPRYRFRRATLYTWLRGLIPDALLPELRAIIPDVVARERKLINDRERYWDGREAAYTGDGVRVGNEQKRVTARLMAAQGMSIRAIAEALGVGKSTIDRWLAE